MIGNLTQNLPAGIALGIGMNYLLLFVLCRQQQILPAPVRVSQTLKIATIAQARRGAVGGHTAKAVPTEGGSVRDNPREQRGRAGSIPQEGDCRVAAHRC